MKSITNTVLPYYTRMLMQPGDLSMKFIEQTLTYQQLTENGFPVYSHGQPEIYLSLQFPKAINPELQICRCGKQFSMLHDDWYIAKEGCFYHKGKRLLTGPNSGLYECCNSSSSFSGCARSDYHVSFLHPLKNVIFIRTKFPKRNKKSMPCIYSLDCEMCFTTAGMEIVKVSLVAVNGVIVYDTYVKPKNKVLDYNTAFSGVSEKDLENVDTTLEDAQVVLLSLVHRDSILVGHSLENDLLGLHLIHECIVDTSVVFPHENGFPYKNSLKLLALKYLGKNIQASLNGHDSVEDARTCLELILWKLSLEFYRYQTLSLGPYFTPFGAHYVHYSSPMFNPIFATSFITYLHSNDAQDSFKSHQTEQISILDKCFMNS